MEEILRSEYDLCVVGGGVSGCAAAIEGARQGLKTILIEKGTTLGGLATNGYVPQAAGHIRGVCREFIRRVDEAGQLRQEHPHPTEYVLPIFDPEYAKLTLEEMVLESGCELWYDAVFTAAETRNGAITAARFYTEGGERTVSAQIFVDATGTAQLAFAAGADCQSGSGEYDGFNMSTTQGSRWAGADLERYQAAEETWRAERIAGGETDPVPLVYALEEEAIRRGEFTRHICNRYNGFHRIVLPNTPMNDAEFATFAFHSYRCQNGEEENISRQITEQHAQMLLFLRFLRAHVPGFERLRLTGTGSLPGFREGRRIRGEYTLTDEEFVTGAKFPDAVARYPETVATHHPTDHESFFIRHVHIPALKGSAIPLTPEDPECARPGMHPHGAPAGIPVKKDPLDWCEIPYRAMLPREVDNLLAVGRCCSAEFHATSALRVIGPGMETGQAAGIAAALALRKNVPLREIPGEELRSILEGERQNEAAINKP